MHDHLACPHCGSSDVEETTRSTKVIAYLCNCCAKIFRVDRRQERG